LFSGKIIIIIILVAVTIMITHTRVIIMIIMSLLVPQLSSCFLANRPPAALSIAVLAAAQPQPTGCHDIVIDNGILSSNISYQVAHSAAGHDAATPGLTQKKGFAALSVAEAVLKTREMMEIPMNIRMQLLRFGLFFYTQSQSSR
jgi:hypothetical protein